jgi:methanogenic corrinoid protein MtbC1
MDEVGERWYRGEIGAAGEHRAWDTVTRVVEHLPEPPSAPVPNGRLCWLAAIAPEEHGLGLRLVQLALADAGWDARLLGTQVAPRDLLREVASTQPALVGLSAAIAAHALAIAPLVKGLQAAGVRVLVGGSAFRRRPGLAESVGADAYAIDARVAVQLAQRLQRA